MKSLKIAIVGSTGVVGQEMEKILLEDPSFKEATITRFASSSREAKGQIIYAYSPEALGDFDFILGASDATVAQSIGHHLGPGQVFIDNSSAFRGHHTCPLVVPEINGELLKKRKPHEPFIVANPNCTAILLCMTLSPLQKKYGLKRVVVSTYQAASGAGLRGLEELEGQIQHYGKDQTFGGSTETFGHPLFLNVMSHNSSIRTNELEDGFGYNDEEWKVVSESQKILDLPQLSLSATCMRVPVRRAHTETVSVDLERPWELDEVRKLLAQSAGVKLVDNVSTNHFPMPLEAQEQDLVLVGRIRRDTHLPGTLHYILAGDQLRKGAALNAVQILKAMLV